MMMFHHHRCLVGLFTKSLGAAVHVGFIRGKRFQDYPWQLWCLRKDSAMVLVVLGLRLDSTSEVFSTLIDSVIQDIHLGIHTGLKVAIRWL